MRRPNTEEMQTVEPVYLGKQEIEINFIDFLLLSVFPFNLESSEILLD